jgi:hypothetical protein
VTLRMRHDDGFAAWLNGVEVARMNAPAALAHDSAATCRAHGERKRDVRGMGSGRVHRRAARRDERAGRAGAERVRQRRRLFPAAGTDRRARIGATPLYFTSPSPGGAAPPGSAGWLGLVGDTRTSTNRGATTRRSRWR